jgi:hypothetical protein
MTISKRHPHRTFALTVLLAAGHCMLDAVTQPLSAQAPVRFTYDAAHFGFAGVGPQHAILDLDGDGFLDLSVGSPVAGGLGPRLFWNNGNATFTPHDLSLPPGVSFGGAGRIGAVGDVDGDGRADIVVAGTMPRGHGVFPPRVFLNRGNRQFDMDRRGGLPEESMGCDCAALFDADGDGDLDLLLYGDAFSRGNAERLFLNDGTGMFQDVTATHLPVLPSRALSVCVADLDGNGSPDLAWAMSGTHARVMLNDGQGRFHVAWLMPETTAQRIIAGDVDGDGALDLFVAVDGPPDRLYRNSGVGVFADESHRLPYAKSAPEVTMDACFVDIDGDDDLDLVISNRTRPSDTRYGPRLWRNDGTGRFTDVTSQSIVSGNEPSWGTVAAGDFDRDGDMDLLGTVVDQLPVAGRVLIQHRRHVRVPASVPYNANFPVEISAGAGSTVFPMLGLPGPSVLLPPLGPIGLAQPTVLLAPVTFPSATTRSFPIFVPDNPSLLGATLRVQAVDLGYDGGTTLVAKTTNWSAFRIH